MRGQMTRYKVTLYKLSLEVVTPLAALMVVGRCSIATMFLSLWATVATHSYVVLKSVSPFSKLCSTLDQNPLKFYNEPLMFLFFLVWGVLLTDLFLCVICVSRKDQKRVSKPQNRSFRRFRSLLMKGLGAKLMSSGKGTSTRTAEPSL